MRKTKIIDTAGQFFEIRIEENIQTLAVTVSGTYVASFQLVAGIDLEGQDFEPIPYNADGTVADLTGAVPVDFFLDVGGFGYVRIYVPTLTSGKVNITIVGSSAKRSQIGGTSGGTGEEVQVTNFPAVQTVTGPLTDTQLRAAPVVISDLEGAKDTTVQQILQLLYGFDSTGQPLPVMFSSVGSTFTYDGDFMQTETRIVGTDTYQRTITNDGSKYTSVSPWVRL